MLENDVSNYAFLVFNYRNRRNDACQTENKMRAL